MLRVLVTGGAGLLAGAIMRLAPSSWEMHATRRTAPVGGAPAHQVELSNSREVQALWERLRPELVIHTAYTMTSPERDVVEATRNVAHHTAAVGAGLIHMSSDMVFDGDSAPYAEEDRPGPISDYGRAKAEAEALVMRSLPVATIVRTSLIVSLDPLDPRCAWVAAAARGEDHARLFVDEIRSPILADDLARQIVEIAALRTAARAGIWHLAGPESLSRFALGVIVAAALKLPVARLEAASIADSATPRPRDLRLLTGRADRELEYRARAISTLAAGG